MSERVLLVTPSLEIGGAERVTVLLARALAHAGVETVLVAIDGSGPLRDEVLRPDPDGASPAVDFVDLSRRRARQALPALVRTIRAHRPSIIFSSQTHLSTLLVLSRATLGRHVRIIAREPMLWIDGPRERFAVRTLRRIAQRRADVVVASSPVMRAQLEQVLGRRVQMLPNPVDVAALRDRAAVAERPPGPGRRLVYVGRFAQGKGIEDLLEAFGAASDPDDVLTLVGDGPTRPLVEATVARLGLSENVVLPGAVIDPAPLLAGADALVLPSRSEGMPNAALEALAVGTPIIATTDLTTLAGLARRVGEDSLQLVPRAELGEAIADIEPLRAGPRPDLLPAEHLPAEVARRLLAIGGGGSQTATDGERDTLRILLPMLAPYPSALASTVQSVNMAEALAELGHDVRLVAANHDPSLGSVAGPIDPAGLYGFTPTFRAEVLSRNVRRGQSYRHALRLATIAHQWGADLVVSRDLRGCLIPALRGTPTVLEVHSLSSFEGRQDRWVLRRLLRARGFRGFVTISAALADDLATAHGIRRADILVAHDAVRPLPVMPARRRAPSDPLRVGYTGSLFAGRGVELLVEVVSRAPWLELHLVGGPASAADGWRERIGEPEGGGRIVVHGMVGPARSRELQQEVDVLVAPFGRQVITDSGVDTSRWMSPMKVFEYMVSGRPMVISDLPVLREVIRPDVDALMVPPGDLEALVAALVRLRDEPDLGARLAAAARERARTEFTWELRARRILERFGA